MSSKGQESGSAVPYSDDGRLTAELRCSAVVLRGDELLLVKHRRGHRAYWVLPGGHPRRGETAPVAVQRELAEETGLKVEASRVLFVWETVFPHDTRHIFETVFLGHLQDIGADPVSHSGLEEPRFLPIGEIHTLDLYPPIAGYLRGASKQGFRAGAPHLGNMWREMDSKGGFDFYP